MDFEELQPAEEQSICLLGMK